MKSCTGFIILILLELFFKVSSGANSTQVYYLEVQIEEGVYKNFKDLIRDLTLNVNNSATVRNISITTECSSLNTEKVNCTCNSGYSWSEEVRQNYTECGNENSCTFNIPNPRAMCLSENRVLVNGSFTVPDSFTRELADRESKTYKDFVQNYTTMLEKAYSTLEWFDSLKITGLRQGSVIGDFFMLLTDNFTSAKLEEATNRLQSNNITFELIVTGLVKITRDPQSQYPIPYENNKTVITCTPPEDLGNPLWFFKQSTQPSKDITTGSEAKLAYNPQSSTVRITNSTEVWKGTFICDYKSANSSFIIYRASLDLDVALLPETFITSDPQFPKCNGANKQFDIIVKCIVSNSTENYTVTWTDKMRPFDKPVSLGNGQISYQASRTIFCDEKSEQDNVYCKFQNRLNQTKIFNLIIPIITHGSKVCPQDGSWPDAKANFTAQRLCGSTAVGLEKRECQDNGTYRDVISLCVNRDLSNLLNDAQNLERGLGIVEKNAKEIFDRLKQSTDDKTINTFANLDASVGVLETMYHASTTQNSIWKESVLPDFVKSSSNLLNGSLNDSWRSIGNQLDSNLAFKYLKAVEGIIKQTNITTTLKPEELRQDNVQILIDNKSDPKEFRSDFGVNVTQISSNMSVQSAFKNLANKLPSTLNNETTIQSGVILSVIADNGTQISMTFTQKRLPNHEMYCVYWDEKKSQWSDKGCEWGGVDKPNECICKHLSAFTILMAKEPISLPFMEELTYAGLGFSVVSLALGLIIEFLVWNAVVKTNIAHFRHTVLVNIMVCLLIADCSFLAAPVPSSSPSNWCLSLTVMKHFCYLAVFFWMLCLSLGLLHQVIFVFVHLRKKVYLGLCVFLGYVCPLVIVLVTFITFDNGRTGSYYSNETCWLIYEGMLKGSIHAFVFPVYVIVFLNMFTMVVVISRILKPTLSEGSSHDEKEVARSIVKTIVLLTPTLGITWILGLFVLMLDLTKKPHAQIVAYAFVFFNSFQGFFILLTGCFGEQKVRDALLKRFSSQQSVNYKSESSTKVTSATKRK